MENPRSIVLEWLNSGAQFDQGVALYSRIGRNRKMAGLFPGREKRYAAKLRYELCKSVGIDWQNVAIGTVADSSRGDGGNPVVLPDGDDSGLVSADHYPGIIRRVIHEYAEYYRERSRLHYKMTSVGEGNSSENMAIRADLLSQIKALSARMDVLFEARDNYQRDGSLPDASVLWPPEKPSAVALESRPLPDDPVELRRLKKNLQTYNVKDNNLLLYQSVSIQMEKRPMPQGPKRVGIEKRIRGRLRMIEAIDYKLVEHAG